MKILAWITKVLLILAFPFLLLMGAVRAVITWDYPGFEYPRIASDTYGWSDEVRYELATVNMDYLRSRQSAEDAITMLEALRLPEDDAQPLYNEREISHMVDVKVVADLFRDVFWALLLINIVAALFFLAIEDIRHHFRDILFFGGWATLITLVALGLFIGLFFDQFFVLFHDLFFAEGTWTFYYTDSLIRLFPERFWFDIGLIVVGGTIAAGLLAMGIGYVMRSRNRGKRALRRRRTRS